MATRRTTSGTRVSSWASTPRPMRTSYGASPPTRTTWVIGSPAGSQSAGCRPMASPGARSSVLLAHRDQCGDLVRDLVRRPAGRADGVGGGLLVQRLAGVHQGAELSPRIAEEERTVPIETDPPDRLAELHLEIDHRVVGEQGSGIVVQDRTAAEGEDAGVGGEPVRHDGLLQLPERRLAVSEKDLRNPLPRPLFDHVVGVLERDGEPRRKGMTHGALARPGRADEDDDGRHQRTTRVSR